MASSDESATICDLVVRLKREALAHKIGPRIEAGAHISAKTAADYKKVAKQRLDLSQKSCGKLMEGVSRESWDHHRAALRYESARLHYYHLDAFEEAVAAADPQDIRFHAIRAAIMSPCVV